MSSHETRAHWQTEISGHLPHLSRPQAAVLALWSYGIVLTKSRGITTVAAFLARLLDWPRGNLRQRLREWCSDTADKKRRAACTARPAGVFCLLARLDALVGGAAQTTVWRWPWMRRTCRTALRCWR